MLVLQPGKCVYRLHWLSDAGLRASSRIRRRVGWKARDALSLCCLPSCRSGRPQIPAKIKEELKGRIEEAMRSTWHHKAAGMYQPVLGSEARISRTSSFALSGTRSRSK